MNGSWANSWAIMALVAIPREVAWCYFAFAVVLAIGVVAIFVRGDWQRAREASHSDQREESALPSQRRSKFLRVLGMTRMDTLLLFGPIFYTAPLAAFATEHFTITTVIASLVPAWIPWHLFWAYFVGTCFILAALSLATGIQARLSTSLLALTFFLFVVLMDAPGWARHPRDRFALAFMLRELSFCAGPLALAATLNRQWREAGTQFLKRMARYFIAIAVLYYSLEQFLHGDHVAGVPLEMLTPPWIFGHALWTYLAAVVYAVTGILLLIGKKTRVAATWLGLTVFFVEVVVYVPIAVVERASLEGFNYMADTLMYCGTVLLLAAAMPLEAPADRSSHENRPRASHA